MARILEPSFRVPSEDTRLVPVFGEIALGMTKAQVKNLEIVPLIDETLNLLVYRDVVFGYASSIAYEFENNKLVAISIIPDIVLSNVDFATLQEYFYGMYDILIEYYGYPYGLDTNWYDDSDGYTLQALWKNYNHDTYLMARIRLDYSINGGIRISIN